MSWVRSTHILTDTAHCFLYFRVFFQVKFSVVFPVNASFPLYTCVSFKVYLSLCEVQLTNEEAYKL